MWLQRVESGILTQKVLALPETILGIQIWTKLSKGKAVPLQAWSGPEGSRKLHGYTVHQTMLKPFHYQLMHIMLKNTELLKHSKITLQHVSVYVEA